MLGQALLAAASRHGLAMEGIARRRATHCCDVTDRQALFALLEKLAPGVIINAAAQTSLDACERDPGAAYLINAKLAADLATYCAASGARLVQISTDQFFTGDGRALHDEGARVHLLNEYARTKFAGEIFAQQATGTLIVRTNLVGLRGWPGQPTFVEWALNALRERAPMTLFEDFHTSSIDVDSFADILLALITTGASGLLNVAARDTASKAEFITGLARRLQLSLDNAHSGSVRSLAGAPRAESLGLDVARAERLLQRALPTTEEVLTRIVARIRETT